MKIIVTHLARMDRGSIGVAGVDVRNRAAIRPVVQYGRLDASFLDIHGGPFGMGAVVDLGETWRCGEPPHIEECGFEPSQARKVGEMPPDEFWDLVRSLAMPHIQDGFGDDLQPEGKGWAAAAGSGRCSVGFLAPCIRPRLETSDSGKIRVTIWDESRACQLSLCDCRLLEDDLFTPRRERVEYLEETMAAGGEFVLSLFLTRAYVRPGDTVSRHWLQASNIHLKDDPLGKSLTSPPRASRGSLSPSSVPGPSGGRAELFSERVTARRRTYFFNVKRSPDGARYVVICESRPAGTTYDHSRVFIGEEDLASFRSGLDHAVRFLDEAGRRPDSSYDPPNPPGNEWIEGGS